MIQRGRLLTDERVTRIVQRLEAEIDQATHPDLDVSKEQYRDVLEQLISGLQIRLEAVREELSE